MRINRFLTSLFLTTIVEAGAFAHLEYRCLYY